LTAVEPLPQELDERAHVENSRQPVTISRTAWTARGSALKLLGAGARPAGRKRRDERLHTADGLRVTKFLERRPDVFLGRLVQRRSLLRFGSHPQMFEPPRSSESSRVPNPIVIASGFA
jgi:hypothetical protein